mmetsp:Transcript_88270/g.175423  ORF Transcript_88270/g.175423 Transcript_88270/m.175423 type:complete len:292 (-) Transcript_88270:553-1428(-)|eukprot:CAMPEP_0172741720 /NCGR_PEP_ID=MMETSP1074-20121228/127861_1 /TAXON_ID=2916 /ORGANISM="Ceratium fusus, Strain PA161109" /LENGTH=291 /DNA_ID=CAMNT_0013572093 /DNA_START=287 /DNA_END=1162 /DNA_ORIENTATION=+
MRAATQSNPHAHDSTVPSKYFHSYVLDRNISKAYVHVVATQRLLLARAESVRAWAVHPVHRLGAPEREDGGDAALQHPRQVIHLRSFIAVLVGVSVQARARVVVVEVEVAVLCQLLSVPPAVDCSEVSAPLAHLHKEAVKLTTFLKEVRHHLELLGGVNGGAARAELLILEAAGAIATTHAPPVAAGQAIMVINTLPNLDVAVLWSAFLLLAPCMQGGVHGVLVPLQYINLLAALFLLPPGESAHEICVAVVAPSSILETRVLMHRREVHSCVAPTLCAFDIGCEAEFLTK